MLVSALVLASRPFSLWNRNSCVCFCFCACSCVASKNKALILKQNSSNIVQRANWSWNRPVPSLYVFLFILFCSLALAVHTTSEILKRKYGETTGRNSWAHIWNKTMCTVTVCSEHETKQLCTLILKFVKHYSQLVISTMVQVTRTGTRGEIPSPCSVLHAFPPDGTFENKSCLAGIAHHFADRIETTDLPTIRRGSWIATTFGC